MSHPSFFFKDTNKHTRERGRRTTSLMHRKLTHKEAGYRGPLRAELDSGPGRGLRCDTCHSWDKTTQTCALVEDRNQETQELIVAGGACDIFNLDGSVDLRFLSGADIQRLKNANKNSSKPQAGYTCGVPVAIRAPPGKGFRCGTCRRLNAKQGRSVATTSECV
jgi:hypothetical protein